MSRIGMAIAIAATAAIVMSGCAPASDGGSAQPSTGGDLVIARSADVQSMDKTNTFGNESIYVINQIMEPLFTVTDDGATVEPLLAESYEVSDDKLTYTIALRKDVTFSNGDPMTAADVKFSIDENTKTAEAGWGFINAAIDTVSVIDDNTVEIKTKYAWAPLIADLSLFANGIIPNNYGGKTAEAFYEAPIGTGAFVWGEWKKGQSIKLLKNEKYWQAGKPLLDSVTWNVVPDANTRKLQLQGGQIDIDDTPDWSSFDSLGKTPGITTYAFPSTQINYMIFNQKRGSFSDVHVRRAIALAIDRQALVKTVLFGNGSEANSLLAPGVPFYDKDAVAPTFDLAGAKAELAKSSKPNGFSTTLLIRAGDANQSAVAQIIQAELKELNIEVEVTQTDPTAYKQTLRDSNFDMGLAAWTMDIPDPDQFMSFAVDPKGGANSAYSYYNNPEVTSLAAQAQKEVDQAKRATLYKEVQKLTGEDAFLAYLYYSPYAYASTDKVKGFEVTPLGNYHLENVSKTN